MGCRPTELTGGACDAPSDATAEETRGAVARGEIQREIDRRLEEKREVERLSHLVGEDEGDRGGRVSHSGALQSLLEAVIEGEGSSLPPATSPPPE